MYSKASGMEINDDKSTISLCVLNVETQLDLQMIFPFNQMDMESSLKYLGFILKPNGYTKNENG